MKKEKFICKLLSLISATFLILASGIMNNCVKAKTCIELVEMMHSIPIFWVGGVGIDLFDANDAQNHDAWSAFKRIMRGKFKTAYDLDTCIDADPQDVDSRNFLYLILYIYNVLARSSEENADDLFAGQLKDNAEKVVKNLVYGYRTFNEQFSDRNVLLELSAVRPGFEVLKPLFGLTG